MYEYLGIKDAQPIQITDVFNVVTNLDERVVRRLHCDMLAVGPNTPPAVIEPDGTKTWSWFCGARIKKVGYYDEVFGTSMRYMTTKKDIDEYPWPDPTVNIMEGVVERAKYLHEESDYFVVGATIGTGIPFDTYGFMFTGLDRWLTDMKIRPEFYHQLSDLMLSAAKRRR